MKKVFVTGPDGLLGSNLVRELLNRGYDVTAMVQPGREDTITLQGLPIKKVVCDLLDRNEVIRNIAGHDVVINVAASTAVWPPRHAIHHKVNVEGAQHIIDAVLENKVEKFVHVGSASSFGYGTKQRPGDETFPGVSAKYGLDYVDTKSEGQIMVINAVKERGLPAVVVNPTFMIGPYDSKPSSGAILIAAYKGKIPGFSKGGKNWVYVKDVAVGICSAIDLGRIGECYILGHENLSFTEAVTLISKILKKPPPGITIPSPLIKTAGVFGSFWGMISRKDPGLSYPLARLACDGHYFSPAKAIGELNMPQTPVEQAIREALTWFEQNGYLNN